jgi:hypothetical protein
MQRTILLSTAILILVVTGPRAYNQEPGSPGGSDGPAGVKSGRRESADKRGKAEQKHRADEVKRLKLQRSRRTLVETRGPIYFLEYRAVQIELQLSNRQLEAIKSLHGEFIRQKQALATLTTRENPNLELAKARGADLDRAFEEALGSILQGRQKRRLRQLVLQARGPIATLSDPEVMDQLGLDEYQVFEKAEILRTVETQKQIILQARVSLIDSGTSMFDPRADELLARAQEVEIQGSRAVLKLLDSRQRKIYASLIGESFDFDKMTDHKPRERKADDRKPGEQKADDHKPKDGS